MQKVENVLQVEAWRDEFQKEKERLGSNWIKLVLHHFPAYDTYEGGLVFDSVRRGRGSLERTATLVNNMRQITQKKIKFLPKKSRKLDGKPTQQTLTDLEARRRQRKNITQ